MVVVLCTKQESTTRSPKLRDESGMNKSFLHLTSAMSCEPVCESVNIICLSNEQNLGLVDFHENTNPMRVHAQESMREQLKRMRVGGQLRAKILLILV